SRRVAGAAQPRRTVVVTVLPAAVINGRLQGVALVRVLIVARQSRKCIQRDSRNYQGSQQRGCNGGTNQSALHWTLPFSVTRPIPPDTRESSNSPAKPKLLDLLDLRFTGTCNLYS